MTDPDFQQLLGLYQKQELQAAEALLPEMLSKSEHAADFWHLAGLILFERGKPESALPLLAKAQAVEPERAEFLNSLGIVKAGMHQTEQALALFLQAQRLEPENPRFLSNCAHAFSALKRHAEAIPLYQQVIRLEPLRSEAWLDCGKALFLNHQLETALQVLSRAVDLKAGPEAGYWLGKTCAALGRWAEAEGWWFRSLHAGVVASASALGEYYRQIRDWEQARRVFEPLLQKPGLPLEILHEWVQLLIAQKSYAEAEQILERVLAQTPDGVDWQITRAYLPVYQGRPLLALELLEALLPSAGMNPRLWLHIGNAWIKAENAAKAQAAFLKCLEFSPDYARAYLALGMLAAEDNLFEASQNYLQTALRLDPTDPRPHLFLARMLLLQGKYAEGWQEYEWRHPLLPGTLPAPLWQGQYLQGLHLRILCEQGLGDNLQFASLIPSFWKAQGKPYISLACDPPLAGILAGIEGVAEIAGPQTAMPDVCLRLLSLPLHLDTRLEDLPLQPYLKIPPEPLPSELQLRLQVPHPRVGLVWSSGEGHDTQAKRSLAFQAFEPLIEAFPQIFFFSLQLGVAQQQWQQSPLANRVRDCAPWLTDFKVTARVLAHLDLLISVDTAVAHLAGGLGMPAWILLPFAPDWRWGLQVENAPWYPSLRLFRQIEKGQWESVIQAVIQALHISLPPSGF